MTSNTGGTFECIGRGIESKGGYFGFGFLEEEGCCIGFVMQLLDLGERLISIFIHSLFHFIDIIIIIQA
jgi:hypothetical protein